MPDQPPVDEVTAVMERNPGEVLVRAARQVEVAADAADRRIRMASGEDRVLEEH
jgi:hypothetical protein